MSGRKGMEGFFDDVVRLCSHNGHIFGIPAQFMLSDSFLSYDAGLLEELNLSLPDADWTLDDFYALHSAVYYANFEEVWDAADDERRAEMLREAEENRKEYMTNDLVNMDEKTAENFALYLD